MHKKNAPGTASEGIRVSSEDRVTDLPLAGTGQSMESRPSYAQRANEPASRIGCAALRLSAMCWRVADMVCSFFVEFLHEHREEGAHLTARVANAQAIFSKCDERLVRAARMVLGLGRGIEHRFTQLPLNSVEPLLPMRRTVFEPKRRRIAFRWHLQLELINEPITPPASVGTLRPFRDRRESMRYAPLRKRLARPSFRSALWCIWWQDRLVALDPEEVI